MTGGWCDDSGPRWWGREKPTEPCTSHCDLSGCLRCRLRCVSLSFFFELQTINGIINLLFPLFCSLALSSNSARSRTLPSQMNRAASLFYCVSQKRKWNKRRKKQQYIKQPSTATVCDSTTARNSAQEKRTELRHNDTHEKAKNEPCAHDKLLLGNH